jgi:hypothetical protein
MTDHGAVATLPPRRGLRGARRAARTHYERQARSSAEYEQQGNPLEDHQVTQPTPPAPPQPDPPTPPEPEVPEGEEEEEAEEEGDEKPS